MQTVSQTGKEEQNVFEENTSFCLYELRNELANIKGDDLLGQYLANRLPPSLLVNQRLLIQEAVLCALAFYNLRAEFERLPLWMKLLIEGNGLRNISRDWLQAMLSAFNIFGIKMNMLTKFIQDPALAYRLALYEHAESLLQNKNQKNQIILLRLQAIKRPGAEKIAGRIFNFRGGFAEHEGLIASLAVYRSKSGCSVPFHWLEELSCWLQSQMEQIKEKNDKELVSIVHVINSLNFVLMKLTKTSFVKKNLKLIENSILPAFKSKEIYNHIEGIYNFHLSILARHNSDQKTELECLLRAQNTDCGFTDYYYRIAQIYHDWHDFDLAKTYYEKAISTSPFNFPLFNDYGCLLTDMNLQDDLKSWSALCRYLYQSDQEKNERQ